MDNEIIQQMKEESAKPPNLVPKTIRLDEEMCKDMANFAEREGVTLAVLYRTTMRVGWGLLNVGNKASR